MLISSQDLLHRLNNPDVKIFDCTINIHPNPDGSETISGALDAFRKQHIPGAGFIDLTHGFSDPHAAYPLMAPSPELFQQSLRNLGLKHSDMVVVYSSGNPWWATRLWWLFNIHGLKNIHVLDGGLRNWLQLGLPIETGDPIEKTTEGTITTLSRLAATVTADEILNRLDDPSLCLINALSKDRFSGKTIVHGGRPGHIPGSRNLPASSLIDPQTHRFLDTAEIEVILRQYGLLDDGRDAVIYCGGGISATLILYALELIGARTGKLYDASLYEWGHRPDLPMTAETQAL